MKILHLLVAAGIAVAAAQVSARTPVPIVDHENVVMQKPAGGAASAAEVKKALLAAASATGRKWVISEPTPGRLLATYHVRTHTIVTEIQYKAGQFSVKYHDSTNMKYAPSGPAGAGPVIHPFYNQWVQDFIQAARLELTKV